MYSGRLFHLSLASVLSLCAACGPVDGAAESADTAVTPVALDGDYDGITYADLTAGWVQWMAGQPATGNPTLDTTGEDCTNGQSGDVFYLAGTFFVASSVNTITRDCTIGADKAIFFPLLNNFAAVTQEDPNDAMHTIDDVHDWLYTCWGEPQSMYATLDGVSLGDPFDYLAASDEFEFQVPYEDSLFSLLWDYDYGGTWGPALAIGYSMLLEPLPPGEHTLTFGMATDWCGDVDGSSDISTMDITYHLTIE
jgi:hypothetical protein